MSVRALSSSSAAPGWSAVAVQNALQQSKLHRAALKESGVLNLKRPIKITAEPYSPSDGKENLGKNSKIIHLQRHGQGYHNLVGDVVRELGNKIDLDDPNPITNPFIRPEMVDSPLTTFGWDECAAWRTTAAQLQPELIVISPLCRTIQTAMATFADFYSDDMKIPWTVHEGIREELGLLTCNQRRPLSQTKRDFPTLDYSNLPEDEKDPLWIPDRRESALEKTDRGYDFLVNFIRNRPESEIAIVSHSAFLFNMLNAVMDCNDDEDLQCWFRTGEIRSLKVTFE